MQPMLLRQRFRYFSEGARVHSLPAETGIHVLNPCRSWLQSLEFISHHSKHSIISFSLSEIQICLWRSGLRHEASLSYHRASVAPESHTASFQESFLYASLMSLGTVAEDTEDSLKVCKSTENQNWTPPADKLSGSSSTCTKRVGAQGMV